MSPSEATIIAIVFAVIIAVLIVVALILLVIEIKKNETQNRSNKCSDKNANLSYNQLNNDTDLDTDHENNYKHDDEKQPILEDISIQTEDDIKHDTIIAMTNITEFKQEGQENKQLKIDKIETNVLNQQEKYPKTGRETKMKISIYYNNKQIDNEFDTTDISYLELKKFISSKFNINVFWMQYNNEYEKRNIDIDNHFQTALEYAQNANQDHLEIFVIEYDKNTLPFSLSECKHFDILYLFYYSMDDKNIDPYKEYIAQFFEERKITGIMMEQMSQNEFTECAMQFIADKNEMTDNKDKNEIDKILQSVYNKFHEIDFNNIAEKQKRKEREAKIEAQNQLKEQETDKKIKLIEIDLKEIQQDIVYDKNNVDEELVDEDTKYIIQEKELKEIISKLKEGQTALKELNEELNGVRQEYDNKLDVLSKQNNELMEDQNKMENINNELMGNINKYIENEKIYSDKMNGLMNENKQLMEQKK
eukprot:372373_1